jgi:hypothetical protein
MSPKDKASKSIWGLFEFTRDTVKKNITATAKKGDLSLDENTLKTLFSLIDASVSEGFNKGHDTVLREVLDTKKN